MTLHLGLVVEGHSDVTCAPSIVNRACEWLDLEPPVLRRPVRVPKARLLKGDQLERAVRLAAANVGGAGAVLVLIDADDDCPKTLAPALVLRTQAAGVPAALVLARRELESWFVAGCRALGGVQGLASGIEPPAAPEDLRNPKKWLEERMRGRSYGETVDAPHLARRFDLAEARRLCPSFDKFCREIQRLVEAA
jgi:hypothetical protein